MEPLVGALLLVAVVAVPLVRLLREGVRRARAEARLEAELLRLLERREREEHPSLHSSLPTSRTLEQEHRPAQRPPLL